MAAHVRLRRRRGSRQGRRPDALCRSPRSRGRDRGAADRRRAARRRSGVPPTRRDAVSGRALPQDRAQRRGRDRGAARHRHRHLAAQVAGGPASPGAEDGSGRPAHRRHRPRLQQHPDGHPGQRRCAGRSEDADPAVRRRSADRRRPSGRRPDAQLLAFSRKLPLSRRRRPQRAGRRTGRLLRRTLGDAGRDRHCAGRRPLAGRGRSGQLENGAGQSLRQRPRCHARRRQAADRDRERRAGRDYAGRIRTPHPALMSALRHRHRHRHGARGPGRASSSRSSPPRKWARERAGPEHGPRLHHAVEGPYRASRASSAAAPPSSSTCRAPPSRRPSTTGMRLPTLPRGHEGILVVEDEPGCAPPWSNSCKAWATR